MGDKLVSVWGILLKMAGIFKKKVFFLKLVLACLEAYLNATFRRMKSKSAGKNIPWAHRPIIISPPINWNVRLLGISLLHQILHFFQPKSVRDRHRVIPVAISDRLDFIFWLEKIQGLCGNNSPSNYSNIITKSKIFN